MYAIFLVLGLVLSLPAIAQAEILALQCQGVVETSKDGRLDDTSRTTVSVLIDLNQSTAYLDGNWGCTARFGNVGGDRKNDQCYGWLPVSVSDAEIATYIESDGPLYRGLSNFTINRYTGVMHSSGAMLAKPPSNANWSVITTSGTLNCTKQSKKF
jgi:hypothetical protein